MTAYNPQPFIRVNGVTWTGETLEGVSITAGRNQVNEQPRAGYARVTILTPDTANYPDIAIDQVIEIGVLDTAAVEKILFTGQVSDIQVSLGAYGDTGFLVSTSITAVGRLALLNRLAVGGAGYPQELDGQRVERVVGEAIGLNYVDYGDYYDDNEVLPTRTNLILNPSIEVNTTGWIGSGATLSRITTDSFIGNAAAQLVCLNVGNNRGLLGAGGATYRVPVVTNDTFTASAYVKNTVGTRNIFMQLRGYAGASGGANLQSFTSTIAVNPTGWTRLTVTGTFTNASVAFADLYIRTISTGAIGDTFLVDGIMMEKAPAPVGTYFDGSLLATQPVYWTGTPHDSTSVRGGNAGTYVVAGDQTWATLDPYLSTFDSGDYDVLAYSSGEANAYQLASAAAQSGLGVLYETAENRIGYKDAESRVDETEFNNLPADVIIASGIQATQRSGDLANDITLTYGANLSVQDENQGSIDTYGRLAAKVDTILADSDSANALLDYYLATRSLPRRTLESLLIGLHLDTMENTLRDELLDVHIGMGIQSLALPQAIYPDVFTGFVEGWTWTITRNTLFLQLRVSEYLLSGIAEQWGQVDPAEAWNTISATLEWQEARVIS